MPSLNRFCRRVTKTTVRQDPKRESSCPLLGKCRKQNLIYAIFVSHFPIGNISLCPVSEEAAALRISNCNVTRLFHNGLPDIWHRKSDLKLGYKMGYKMGHKLFFKTSMLLLLKVLLEYFVSYSRSHFTLINSCYCCIFTAIKSNHPP